MIEHDQTRFNKMSLKYDNLNKLHVTYYVLQITGKKTFSASKQKLE